MEWWQWNSHGDNHQCDVKVVVFRDTPLKQVMTTCPVVREKEQDYRYLSYAKAMAYLNATIQENVVFDVTERLKQTKARIEKEPGKPNNEMQTTN